MTNQLRAEPNFGVKTPDFKNQEFSCFRAEFGARDRHLVFHFKLLEKDTQLLNRPFWRQIFPDVLSAVAQAYFRAEYPRLRAAYTEEMESWWMEAQGFAEVSLDPDAFALGFLSDLSLALEKTRDK